MESSFLDTILALDTELLLYLNGLGTFEWDGFWLFVTSKYATVPLYFILLVVVLKNYGLKKTLLFLILGVALITASDQLANLFKYGFKRLRPCLELNISDVVRLVKSSCGGKYAFFSAHASTGMALAVYFSLMLHKFIRPLPYVLFLVACLVGYSRIYIGVHYPLDVITGFLIGAILAYGMYQILQLISKKTIRVS